MLTTPVKAIPYPEESDAIAAYPAIIEALAAQVDALLALGVKAVATGTQNVTFTASPTSAAAAIAFPVGRFSTTPRLFVSLTVSTSGKVIPRGTATSTTAGTVSATTGDATNLSGTVTVNWLAVEV